MPLSRCAPAHDYLPVRVLLVDDYLPLLEQIFTLLAEDFVIVGRVTTGLEMIKHALEYHPDVIVADVNMPDINGIEAVRRLRNLDVSCAVIFLSMNSDAEIITAALATGAMGYVHKSRAGAELIPAIRHVIQGQKFISPALLKSFR